MFLPSQEKIRHSSPICSMGNSPIQILWIPPWGKPPSAALVQKIIRESRRFQEPNITRASPMKAMCTYKFCRITVRDSTKVNRNQQVRLTITITSWLTSWLSEVYITIRYYKYNYGTNNFCWGLGLTITKSLRWNITIISSWLTITTTYHN